MSDTQRKQYTKEFLVKNFVEVQKLPADLRFNLEENQKI